MWQIELSNNTLHFRRWNKNKIFLPRARRTYEDNTDKTLIGSVVQYWQRNSVVMRHKIYTNLYMYTICGTAGLALSSNWRHRWKKNLTFRIIIPTIIPFPLFTKPYRKLSGSKTKNPTILNRANMYLWPKDQYFGYIKLWIFNTSKYCGNIYKN